MIRSSFAIGKLILVCLISAVAIPAAAQNTTKKTRLFDGMYLQWGYNTETYTRSDLHFKMANGNNFTLHQVKAHNSPDFDAILKGPEQISIPQYNYRIGFYLNKQKTKAIELNFDHAKYIVTDFQKVHVTGIIDGKPVDGDSILNPATFLHMEHTDGANWLHINYVSQHVLATTKGTGRNLFTWLWKAGAGINIPRTDFTWRGDRLNNYFHVAGYNISVESGFRLYPFKKFFIETTGKTGYVNYLNALADTRALKGNRVSHHFFYGELIATVGFDINF